MAKLGPRKYRYTITILSVMYMISAILGAAHIGIEIGLKHEFPTIALSVMIPGIVVACFGVIVLRKEQGPRMRIYGKLLIGLTVLQIFGFIVLVYVTYKRRTIVKDLLNELMASYRTPTGNIIDTIQNHFKCCGRESYRDWPIPPPASCCNDCSDSFYFLYHDKGCAATLGPYFTCILMVFALISILQTILHVFATKSAFELAKIYDQAQRRSPSITPKSILE